MGMRVGGNSSAWAANGINQWQQRNQSVKDLFSALNAGDLSGAQQAISKIPTGNTDNAQGPFAAISKALAANDLQGAQQAAQSMHGRHHHHHTQASNTTPGAQGAPTVSPIDPVALAAGTGMNINLLA